MKNLSQVMKFFRKKENSLIFDGSYMEIYIPSYYFKESVATFSGNLVYTLGLFHFGIFPSEEANFNERQLFQLLLPVNLNIGFSEVFKENKQLKKELDEENYTILKLYKGDIFIKSLEVVKDADATVKFINLLHAGKIPKDISYDDLLKIYNSSLNINAVNLGVPSLVLEFTLAELYRNKSDVTKSFRFDAGIGNVTMYDYQTSNLKDLASLNSTFTALSFEKMNQSLISSINKSRDGTEETISPVEKIIKY